MTELKAQGRNLNQLTTLANMGKIQMVHGRELIERYADLCKILSSISTEVK